MATKSFTSEFKFNQKSSLKLLNALENSKRVEHTFDKKVNDVSNAESIKKIVESFLEEK